MKTKCGRAGRLLLAAALAVMLLLTGCASKSRKAAQRLELGQKYLTEMNYTEAVTAFTQVIRLMPENIPAYLGRAEAYVGLEQYEAAKNDYTAVIEKSEKTNRPYTEVQGYMGRANVNELLQENSATLSDYEAAKSLLEQIDWSKFKEVTEKIIRNLLDRIEEACRRLRELLDMEEDSDTEEPGGEDIFQSAMDSLTTDSKYANSRKYVIPADYDGDGKQEAFAVCGDFKDGLAENFQIFFISSDGTVTRQNTDGLMGGRVFNYENYDGTSDSVLVKAGSRRVFVREMPGAGNMPTVFFGVRNGKPYVLDISWQYAWFTEDNGHYYVDNGRYDEGSYEIEYNASTWQFELNGNVKHY